MGFFMRELWPKRAREASEKRGGGTGCRGGAGVLSCPAIGATGPYMEKTMNKWLVVLAMLVLGATSALADWKTVAEITATDKGEARELAVNRTIRTVQIECTEGSVIVNTLWVREGGAKTEIRVARLFNKGDKQDFDLSYDRNVTGFRISDKGPGKYKVHAK